MSKRKWTLRQHFNYLQKHIPLDKPVRLKICECDGLCGDISEDEAGYLIRIDMNISLPMQKDSLWHEYAHAVAGWSDKHMHTNKWGITYARIYRLMQEEV